MLLSRTSLAILLFLAVGCAYQMGIAGRSLPGGYRQIGIPLFTNRSLEVGAEVAFTNAIIRQFEESAIAQVVPVEIAPLRLEGEIESIKYESSSAATTKEVPALPERAVLTTAFRVLVTARLRLKRASDQAVVWEGVVTNERPYKAPRIGTPVVNSANVLYNQSERQINLNSLAIEMMEEAHDRMTENF